jgi:hypothetical protein
MHDFDDDRTIAQGAFEFAKTRFVRSLDAERNSRLIEKTGKERARLHDEIVNLQLLTRDRHETALEYARAYGSVLPHRVGKTWIQPPASFEKIGQSFGADRLYKQAARAVKEYTEARELLVKRRDQLNALEEDLQARREEREAVLLGQLESSRSLRIARQLDPLLDTSYQKLQALGGSAPPAQNEYDDGGHQYDDDAGAGDQATAGEDAVSALIGARAKIGR